jgi:ABC-type molybdate transport system permease subunit
MLFFTEVKLNYHNIKLNTMNEQKPMSVGDWVITLLLTAIPLVGFILLIVWAFSSDTHPSKQNWAKAYLIFMVAGLIIAGLFFSTILGALIAFSNM